MSWYKILPISFILFLASMPIYGQSYFYGFKGGFGLNMQQWNSFERDILFSPTVDLYLESYDELPSRLYGSLGYHTRGSTVRGLGFSTFAAYKFNNIVLEVGGKRMISQDKKYNGYYMLGIRGEYTISTNLGDFNNNATSLFNLVDDAFVRRFVYGASVGAGIEYEAKENTIVFAELSVNPDISKQYEQVQSFTYTDPSGRTFAIRPQDVRNVSLELRFGVKFLRL